MKSGTVDFAPAAGSAWRQFVTLIQPIDLADFGPIVMMATRYDPNNFFPKNNNVALTAVQIDNRIAIAATNLSTTPLNALQVTWWAFKP